MTSIKKLNKLKKKALSLGADHLDYSTKKNKRFMILFRGKWIHFGSHVGNTFIDHKDKKKRSAWYARHSKVLNKKGQKVINLKTSPSYWSARILWD